MKLLHSLSASNQELEIALVYNPNDKMEKTRNLKASVTHLANNGCINQLIIGDYKDLVCVGYSGQEPHHASRDFLFFIFIFRVKPVRQKTLLLRSR